MTHAYKDLPPETNVTIEPHLNIVRVDIDPPSICRDSDICEEAKLGPARACACDITEARAHFTAGKAPGPFRGQNKGLIGRGPVAFRRQNEKRCDRVVWCHVYMWLSSEDGHPRQRSLRH